MAKVWRTRYGESQNKIVLDVDPLNPGAVVTDSSLAIWVGNNPEARRVSEIVAALDECMNALIEANAPVPTNSYQSARRGIDASKVNIIVVDDGGEGFNDATIGVLYGPNYPENATGDGRNQLLVSQFEWLKEKFLEWSKLNA